MKFIRLDEKGTWRGTEHCSQFGLAEETFAETEWIYDPATGEEIPVEHEINGGTWEAGISCYNLNDIVDALEHLHNYWFGIAGFGYETYKGFQVTVFEGELTERMGADWEDTAICENTLVEAGAYEFMKSLHETIDKYEEEEITEEEYRKTLEELYNELK